MLAGATKITHCESIVKISLDSRCQLIGILISGIAYLLCSQISLAGDDDRDSRSDGSTRPQPRHRIDISAIFLDSVSADSLNGILGYTYNFTSNSNFNISVPYLDPERGMGGNSGFGDATMALSFVPSVIVSANPWVPRTVGTGVAILVPTGNANEGRSLDTWVVAPYLGFVIPLTDRVFLAPQLGYIHSVDKTVADTDLRLVFGEVGLSFVAFNGFWSSYFPQFVRDLESDKWAINHRFAIGKMLSQNVGVSMDYTFIERFNFGSDLPGEAGFDEQIQVNVHFAF